MIKIPLVLAIVLASVHAYAQDILTTKSGEEIPGKVLEINVTSIKYKKITAQDTSIYEIAKSDLLMVRYENGTKEIFNNASNASPALTDAELYAMGKKDASVYYAGYKGAGTGTFFAGLLSPLVGLIPAIACSSTTPKDQNLNYPDASLMKKIEYRRGYVQVAKKIKRQKVWTNWWITFGINAIATIALNANH